jgi:hypothetical protein
MRLQPRVNVCSSGPSYSNSLFPMLELWHAPHARVTRGGCRAAPWHDRNLHIWLPVEAVTRACTVTGRAWAYLSARSSSFCSCLILLYSRRASSSASLLARFSSARDAARLAWLQPANGCSWPGAMLLLETFMSCSYCECEFFCQLPIAVQSSSCVCAKTWCECTAAHHFTAAVGCTAGSSYGRRLSS